jgi:hypothetical protein
MVLTPIHRIPVNVHSMEFRATVAKKPSDGAPASASKIEHSMRAPNIDPHVTHALTNQTCTALTNAQELAHGK